MTKRKYRALVWMAALAVTCASPTAYADEAAGDKIAAAAAARTAEEMAGGSEKNADEVKTEKPKETKPNNSGVWWAREEQKPKPNDPNQSAKEAAKDAEEVANRAPVVNREPEKNPVWWAKDQADRERQAAAEAKAAEEVKNADGEGNKIDDKPKEPEKLPRMAGTAIDDKEAAANWSKTRPDEKAINADLEKYEGKTVVDIVFEGASEKTFPTARAALSMHIGDTFSVKALERDRDAVYSTGYFYDLYPAFEEVPEGVIITYHVLQNPVLQKVIITGNTVEPTDKLMKLLPLHTGELLNSVALHEGIESINKAYREDDYILAKIVDMNIDRDGVLTLKINEGILEGYSVKGNTKTKDYVILREMRQKTGEPFNAKLARRSMQRVYNLGFFEDVNIKMNPGVEPNAVVMELDVKEKRTGAFGIGAGYSNQDGVVGMVSVSDMNFRGIGDSISFTYEVSGNDLDAHGYTFNYRRPWLDKRETSMTFRLYNRAYRYSDYDTNGDLKEKYMRKYSGGEITFSRPVSEYSTNYITLRNRKDSYERHISDGNLGDRSTALWKPWRDDNFGTTRSITFEHVTDTRDNVYDPTEGGRISLSGEIGGFGGDFNFRKVSVQDQRFRKMGRHQVLAMRVGYGLGSGEISEFNQFKVGGQNTLRGYREDQFRGDRMFLATLEYRFPLFKKVRGAIFTDWGSAWEGGVVPKNIKGSIGVGVSLETPLGPLRLDYGRGQNGGRVHFSIGNSF